MSELTFTSEDERTKAFNEVPEVDDAPNNTNLEEYRIEIEKKINDIQNAKIVSPDEKKNEQVPQQSVPLQSANPPASSEGIDPVQAELELQKTRNESLVREREERERRHQEKMTEFEEKLKRLESNSSQPSDEDKSKTPTEEEINSVQNQINKLEKEMNDPDADVFDEDYIKNMKTQGDLNTKLNRLLMKRQSEQDRTHKSQIEEILKEQALKKKNRESEENKGHIQKKIEKFREDKPELQGKTYDEMDTEYTAFAKEVASLWYDKDVLDVKPEEGEMAVDKYLRGTPALITAMQNRGLKEPEEMRKFILLSEINATKMGYKMNAQTGKWEKMFDEYGKRINFPSFDAAYDYIKGSNSKKEVFDAERNAVKGALNAINQRQNPVELNNDYKGNAGKEMTREEATNVLNTFDEEQVEMRRRRDELDPMVQEYNKALQTLGYGPLAGD